KSPQIERKETIRVVSIVNEAVENDCVTVLTGCYRAGAYYAPTVLSDVVPGASIAQAETFGPVVMVFPVDDIDEAIEKSNAVDYGLQAGIFTNNVSHAFKAVERLDYGGVMVNDTSDYRIDGMPFGGTKGSGLGREGV